MIAAIFASCARRRFRRRRTQAQRDAIKSQCRSDYMAHCSQRTAGRRGIAAMSPEEHVEPLIGLPGCGACRGSAGGRRQTDQLRARRAKTESARRPQPQNPPPRPRRRKPRPARRRNSQQRAGLPRFAAPAAPTIPRSAQACRPAARRRCNAWKRTRQSFRPLASEAVAAASGGGAAGGTATRLPLQRLPRQRQGCSPSSSCCGADAAGRRTVRTAVGYSRRRCPFDLRRRVAPGGGRSRAVPATNAASLSPTCKDVLSQFAAR